MTILIIGGAGFIGRNLLKHLAGNGLDLVVLDRNTGGLEDSNHTLIVGDAQDPELLTDVMSTYRPETVYHFAANSDIGAGVADASLDFGDTLMTTVALRSAVDRIPVPQVVFASSSAIFGVSNTPLTEVPDLLPQPVSWYGRAKLASEFALESTLQSSSQTQMLFVRFPNVVGPLATHGVVYDFVRKLRADPNHLQVLGDGHQTKPYVHVAELIAGIEFFRNRLESGVTRINIGPMDLVDVRGIVNEVCSVLNVTPEVVYEDSPYGWPGDVPRYEFNTALMRAKGFEVKDTSREAVRRAAEDLAREWPSS